MESGDDWSYQAGLKYGWIPKNPTEKKYVSPTELVLGHCKLGADTASFCAGKPMLSKGSSGRAVWYRIYSSQSQHAVLEQGST